MSKSAPLPMEANHKRMISNQRQGYTPYPFMDKTPHLAVENKKEDATSQQEQQSLYGTGAEIYERGLVPAIFAPWATILIEQAALQPGERVLDLACGTGVVARLAAQQVGSTGQIIGLDNNTGTLAVARSLHQYQASRWSGRKAVHLPCPLRMRPLTPCCVIKVCSFSRIARQHSVRCTGCWCPGDDWSSASGALWSVALATPRWLGRLSITSVRQPPRSCVLLSL